MKEHIQLLLTMMIRNRLILLDNNQSIFKNPNGIIFLTVGTAGDELTKDQRF